MWHWCPQVAQGRGTSCAFKVSFIHSVFTPFLCPPHFLTQLRFMPPEKHKGHFVKLSSKKIDILTENID